MINLSLDKRSTNRTHIAVQSESVVTYRLGTKFLFVHAYTRVLFYLFTIHIFAFAFLRFPFPSSRRHRRVMRISRRGDEFAPRFTSNMLPTSIGSTSYMKLLWPYVVSECLSDPIISSSR